MNSKTETQKQSYMQDYFNRETSKSSYQAYQQKLNDEQKKVYDSSFNNSYRYNNTMNFEDAMRTRPQRVSMFDSRPVRIYVNNNYFGGPISYGSAFVGPWDMWFLMRATDLFWYHHWNDIYPYRDYFDAAGFAAREQAIREMEPKNIARDPAYLDPDFDPDLQLTDEYKQKHLNEVYYTDKYSKPVGNPAGTVIGIILIAGGLILVIRYVSRPRRRRPTTGGIY